MNSERRKKFKKIFAWKYFILDFVKVTGAFMLLIIRPRKIYVNDRARKKIKGGAIMIANHVGFSDSIKALCAFWYRRINFLVVDTLFKPWIGNFFFTNMQCMQVNKTNFSINVFKDVVDRAKDGKLVLLYPEGIINDEKKVDGVGSFKAGVVLMAFQSDVPIIPIYSPKQKWYRCADVVVGEPINIKEICGPFNMENIEKATNYRREKELELIEVYNERRKKK